MDSGTGKMMMVFHSVQVCSNTATINNSYIGESLYNFIFLTFFLYAYRTM